MDNLIPQNQLCQAFDPMMILPEKTKDIIDNPMTANTSCAAPAYVYLEGSRGKRFLCDFHYEYEKSITLDRTPTLWENIIQILIDNRDAIKETFDFHDRDRSVFGNCWCDQEAFVKLIPHDTNKQASFFCNFHYRKLKYRHLSNNLPLEYIYDIIDDRRFMKDTITEEVKKLTIL